MTAHNHTRYTVYAAFASIITIVISSSLLQGCPAALIAGVAVTGAAVTHDRRSASTIVDDQTIEFRIFNRISSDKDLGQQAHINVFSYNRVVLLTGESPTAELKEKAANIARNHNNVKRIYNAIKIKDPTPLRERNNDTWITSKVKTKMLGRKEVDATRIKVITENSWVYLMGIVTRKEADVAADVARGIKGVNQVVKVFEYMDQ